MNAVEKLEAAIEKLETLRRLGSDGPWRQPRVLLGLPTTSIFAGSDVVGYVGDEDGDLIVTLHRTIDAQLAILRLLRDSWREWGVTDVSPTTNPLNVRVVALADAILGEAKE